jgi:hypothetical protein
MWEVMKKRMWLIVPIIRHVKEATNLTHDEIITKKKKLVLFFFEVVKCVFQNLFSNIPMHKHLDPYIWPKY